MAELQALDYKSVLRDIFDSEEMKIDSEYTEKLKRTVQRICEDGDGEFEKCYEQVRKEVEEVVATSKVNKKEQPYFRGMFLYIAEKLPKVIEDLLTTEQTRDPIIWQVASYSCVPTKVCTMRYTYTCVHWFVQLHSNYDP